jgi:hypothetical protein
LGPVFTEVAVKAVVSRWHVRLGNLVAGLTDGRIGYVILTMKLRRRLVQPVCRVKTGSAGMTGLAVVGGRGAGYGGNPTGEVLSVAVHTQGTVGNGIG